MYEVCSELACTFLSSPSSSRSLVSEAQARRGLYKTHKGVQQYSEGCPKSVDNHHPF